MSFILDSREHALISLLPNSTIQQLPVGDIWIQASESTPVVIIERKTTSDFEASFLDGRYREQRTRLLAYCQEIKAKPLYILEGGLDGKHTRMERNALQKLIHRLLLRYGVAVWSTKSIEDTAETIKLLSLQINDDPKVFEGEIISYTDVQHITKKANKDDPKAFLIAALQGCPGISKKIATTLVDTYSNLKGILSIDEKKLADTKIGEKRLGPTVAKRLHTLLNT